MMSLFPFSCCTSFALLESVDSSLKTVENSSVVVRDPAVITSSDPLIEIRVSLKQQLIFALCTSLWPVVSAQYEWSEQDF